MICESLSCHIVLMIPNLKGQDRGNGNDGSKAINDITIAIPWLHLILKCRVWPSHATIKARALVVSIYQLFWDTSQLTFFLIQVHKKIYRLLTWNGLESRQYYGSGLTVYADEFVDKFRISFWFSSLKIL